MSESSVLWVDDDPYILRSLRRLLRNEQYQLRIAHGGAEALAQLETMPAQVIVSDQRMPDMTGTEFLEVVAQRFGLSARHKECHYAASDKSIKVIGSWRGPDYAIQPRRLVVCGREV